MQSSSLGRALQSCSCGGRHERRIWPPSDQASDYLQGAKLLSHRSLHDPLLDGVRVTADPGLRLGLLDGHGRVSSLSAWASRARYQVPVRQSPGCPAWLLSCYLCSGKRQQGQDLALTLSALNGTPCLQESAWPQQHVPLPGGIAWMHPLDSCMNFQRSSLGTSGFAGHLMLS